MFETSEAIEEIATALSLAQKEMGAALKDADAHHGKYADLASVVAAIKEPLLRQRPTCTRLTPNFSDKEILVTLRSFCARLRLSPTLKRDVVFVFIACPKSWWW